MTLRHCTAAAMALSLASAQAATITHDSAVLPLTNTTWSSFLDLQQFDPTLGTLQSVNVTLFSSLVASLGIENRNTTPGTFNLSITSAVQLVIPSASGSSQLQVVHAASRSFNAAAYDGVTDYAGTSGVRDAEIVASTSISSLLDTDAMLQLFTGHGVVTTSVTATGTRNKQGPGAYATSFSNTTGAHASVTYTYAAAPVPEPTTLALLLAGLAAVAMLASRRQGR